MKKHPTFRLEYDEVLNRNNGVRPVMLPGRGARPSKMALEFGSLCVARFRIIFHPVEVKEVYLPMEFLINEKELFRIQLRARGCKSKIYLANDKVYDMGTVALGNFGVERVVILNREDRVLQLTCMEECTDVIEGEDKQRFFLKHNMKDRFITIIPRCFFIPPNEQVELLVRFNPPCRVNTFTLPIRAYVGGGESTVAVVRARAANPASGIAEQEAPPTLNEVLPSVMEEEEGGEGGGSLTAGKGKGDDNPEGVVESKEDKAAGGVEVDQIDVTLPPGVAELLKRPDGTLLACTPRSYPRSYPYVV